MSPTDDNGAANIDPALKAQLSALVSNTLWIVQDEDDSMQLQRAGFGATWLEVLDKRHLRSIKQALQAQLGKNLRSARMVTNTSAMSRDRCISENNRLCTMGSHARMVVPPSFSALYAHVIVIQGLCQSLIKK
jgi:hypothetical protein